jgi:transcriptional regulator with GAF, ATPase, and Fis domain
VTASEHATQAIRGQTLFVRRFEVTVVDGADRGARAVSTSEELVIGTAEGVDLRLTDPSVSRHHCTLRASARGLELRDLSSTNGTMVADCDVVRAFVRSGARIRLGQTTVTATVLDDEIAHPLGPGDRFGDLIGASPAMRALYPLLERCATSDASVLIQGETGTGKELVAEAIHLASARRDRPFVVVDCGALPHQLLESELFGHVRGAFTGADTERVGAFEQAAGGTIFLDEIGELAVELQPVLLRAIENKTIRRVGASDWRDVDVRIVAATNRDLRVEVNRKRFRADLFYRLNVVRVVVPPLADRADDITLLASHFWRVFAPDRPVPADMLADFARQRWPGNVRELRNAVERTALTGLSSAPAVPAPGRPAAAGLELSYGHAKEHAVRDWERGWVAGLLAAHDHNLSRAARAAKMGRSHLRELARRHGLMRGDDGSDADDGGGDTP